MPPILHVVAASLRPDADATGITRAVELARSLAHAEGARSTLVGGSAERLVAATWLAGRESLEPFAASPAHMAFIMRGIAPVTAGMWSVSVELDAAASPHAPAEARALWTFALPAREGVYEWQVRRLLEELAALPGALAAGPTVEERERYRAGGIIALTAGEGAAFERALASWRERRANLADSITEALVPVLA